MPKSAAQQPVTQHAWELELKAALVEFAHDPEGFADTCIRWGEGELKGKKLRMWQRSILRELGEALRKAPQNADTLIASAIVRIAVASGHGIGKSALIAIIILWAMATCVDCHIPHEFIPKYLVKLENGYAHSTAFTFQNFDEPIRIRDRNARVLQDNCVTCHRATIGGLLIMQSPQTEQRPHAGQASCVRCHIAVGHAASR